MLRFCAYVTGLACRFVSLTRPEWAADLAKANHVLNKRHDGIEREALLSESYKNIKILHQLEDMPQNKHWLNVYLIMLSTQPEHLRATHGAIA